jgi:hypothetical protein
VEPQASRRSFAAAPVCGYRFADDMNAVLKLLEKYADMPMSFADACLVRMTETMNDPMLLTTDTDFRIYRRHGGRSFHACYRVDQFSAISGDPIGKPLPFPLGWPGRAGRARP